MKRLLIAIGIMLGISAQAQVIVLPGEDFTLDGIEGVGNGYIHLYPTFPAPLDGSILVLMAVRDGRGYVQELVGDRVAMEMLWGFPVHVAYPQTLEMDTWYYLRGAGPAGETVLRTEPFMLDGPGINPLLPGGPFIPEPRIFAGLFALGLLTFPLFRTHKPNQKA